MARFEPKDPDYQARVEASFERQKAMRTLGIRIKELTAGAIELDMPYAEDYTQQHGFVHAGTSRRRSTAPAATPPSR